MYLCWWKTIVEKSHSISASKCVSLLSKCLVLFWYLTVLYSLRAISNHNKTNKGTEKSPEITKNACFKKEEDDNDDKKVTSNKSRFEEIYKYPSFDIMWPCRFNNFYDVCDRWGVWWGQFVSLMFLSQCLKSLPLSLVHLRAHENWIRKHIISSHLQLTQTLISSTFCLI